MPLFDEKMDIELAKQRQAGLLREAELDRLAAHLGPSGLRRAANWIGRFMVTLGEGLQRRYPNVVAESPMEFQVSFINRKG